MLATLVDPPIILYMKRFLTLIALLPLPAMALEAVALQPTYSAPRSMSRSMVPICPPMGYITSDPSGTRLICKTFPTCASTQALSVQNNAFACVALGISTTTTPSPASCNGTPSGTVWVSNSKSATGGRECTTYSTTYQCTNGVTRIISGPTEVARGSC